MVLNQGINPKNTTQNPWLIPACFIPKRTPCRSRSMNQAISNTISTPFPYSSWEIRMEWKKLVRQSMCSNPAAAQWWVWLPSSATVLWIRGMSSWKLIHSTESRVSWAVRSTLLLSTGNQPKTTKGTRTRVPCQRQRCAPFRTTICASS